MTPMISASLTVRQEETRDRPAVRAVNVAAFGGDAEADLVERLHDDGDVLFALVAECASQIIGPILFSRLPIETTRGTVVAAAQAPLAVLPEWQRQGIGAALVRHGLALCQERQIAAVVVLGDLAYYGRFGFRAETGRGLQTPWSGPHLMAMEFMPSGLTTLQGVAHYPAAFSVLPSA